MSELAFVQTQLQTRVAPPSISSHIGERIRAAATALQWPYSRTRDIWYGDDRVSLKPHELRTIEQHTGAQYGRQELAELNQLIARADLLLASGDTDFHRAFLDGMRAFFGALDRAGTGGRSQAIGFTDADESADQSQGWGI